MEKYEYFGGVPEVGIVPRAPHAGPLLRHVYEQEHGRGGFAGKVSHTYHLYPPTNWLVEESRVLDSAAWAPLWESPLRSLGGTHHALELFHFANPARISDFALGLSRPGYMGARGGYVTEPRFGWSATRLDEVRGLGERLADAWDEMRPPSGEDSTGH